jgi:integrase
MGPVGSGPTCCGFGNPNHGGQQHEIETQERLEAGTVHRRRPISRRSDQLEKTFGEYVRIFETYISPELGHIKLKRLTEERIQKWVEDLSEEVEDLKSRKEYFYVLRAGLKLAEEKGLVPKNPAAGVSYKRRTDNWWAGDAFEDESPEEQHRGGVDMSRVWSESEFLAFMRASDPTKEIVRWIRIGVELGLRPGELCALRWKDVDLETGVVQVRASIIELDKSRREEMGRWMWGTSKTGARDVQASPEAIEMFIAQKRALAAEKLTAEQRFFVFPSRGKKRPYNNPCNMKNRQRKFLKPSEKFRYICPYALRHTHATRLIRAGWEQLEVAKRLGTSVEMLDKTYFHFLPEDQVEKLKRLPESGLSVHESKETEYEVVEQGWAA